MNGFLLRWFFAFLFLATTYNPTRWCFYEWVTAKNPVNLSVLVLCGLLLIVGYIIYVRATLRSIGFIGMVLVAAITGALLWVAYDLGWINFDNPTANTWVALFMMSFVLGIGLSWSHVRRKLSGQADMDDLDD